MAAPQDSPWEVTGPSVKAGLLAGAVAVAVAAALTYVAGSLAEWAGLDLQPQRIVNAFAAASGLKRAWLVLQIVAITPVAEEFLFRHALERSLAKATRMALASRLAVALLFAAAHANLLAFPALVAVSLLFSRAYDRSGRFATPVVAHAVFNAAGVVLLS